MSHEARHLRRRRDAVVGEVRRDRISGGVESHLLVERLSDTRPDATVLLALDEQRVDDRAAVVDGHMPHEARPTGLGVDLDDRDVGAERERGALAGEHGLRLERAVG